MSETFMVIIKSIDEKMVSDEKRISELEAENVALRQALWFYGNPKNWNGAVFQICEDVFHPTIFAESFFSKEPSVKQE